MTVLAISSIDQPRIDSAYAANMEALWETSSVLAAAVDKIDESEMPECELSKRGELKTCQVVGDNGRLIHVSSRYAPAKEAVTWAKGAMEQAAKQEEGEENHITMCFFVDGFGLGYHVEALFEKLAGDAFIVVSEPDIALLRSALEERDYSEMLSSKRLIFITESDRQEIFNKLQTYSKEMMLGMVFTRPLYQANSEFHQQVHKLVTEYASYLRAHTVSLLANGIITCENVLRNLPTYVATPSIGVLHQRFRGYPAVVVSAGPSLRRSLETLKEIRDKVVVIAVQTTLKPLLNYGIVPDFVTSLDYHPVSKRFFEGLTAEELGKIHLVAEPKANWEVVDYYRERGPVSLLGNDFADTILHDKESHAGLPSGATVAHLAFYLGEYLGCDPIMLIGQDLGFTDNVYYSPGTALHAMWRPEINRFMTMEMKEWQRIARHRNILRQVPDIHGQMIYTDEQMFTYLQQFEKDFAKCGAKVIDASGAGTKKQYCEAMTLGEAAEQYCEQAIPRELFGYRDDEAVYDEDKLGRGREWLEKTCEDVEQFRDISQETVGLVTEMLGLLDDQAAVNKKMIRLDELRTMVKHRPEVYRLIMYVSQNAEMYRFREDRRISTGATEGKERQRRQLQRDVGYVSEIVKGCERLLGMLKDGLERFDAAMGDADTAGDETQA